MQAGDYGERRSEPWTNRKRIVPLKTWSGQILYKRKKHYFTMRDVQKIILKLEPLETDTPDDWISSLKSFLQSTTMIMMTKLLPFLDDSDVEDLYWTGIDFLDQFFAIDAEDLTLEVSARKYILYLADKFGLSITIGKKA